VTDMTITQFSTWDNYSSRALALERTTMNTLRPAVLSLSSCADGGRARKPAWLS
jgi:hypothetical protein